MKNQGRFPGMRAQDRTTENTTLRSPTTRVDVEPSTSSTTLVVDEPPGEPAPLVDVEPLQRPSAPGSDNRESPSERS